MGFTSPHCVTSLSSSQRYCSMSTHRRRHKWLGHFPGDPRYPSSTVKASASDFSCLGKKVYLSTSVLDCILHVSALNPTLSNDISPPMIGSLGCEAFILSLNESNSHPEGNVVEPPIPKNHLSKIRSMFSGMLNDCAPIGHLQRLIIPKVASSHFFVARVTTTVFYTIPSTQFRSPDNPLTLVITTSLKQTSPNGNRVNDSTVSNMIFLFQRF